MPRSTTFSVTHPWLRRPILLDELSVRSIFGRIHPLYTNDVGAGLISAHVDDVLDALETVRQRIEGRCTAPLRDWYQLHRLRALSRRLYAEQPTAPLVFKTTVTVSNWIRLRQRRAEREFEAALSA